MFTFLTKMFKFTLWVVVKIFSIFYCLVLTPLMIVYTIKELAQVGLWGTKDIPDEVHDEIIAKFSIIFCVDIIDGLMDRLAWWKEV